MDKIIYDVMQWCQNDKEYLQELINNLQGVVNNMNNNNNLISDLENLQDRLVKDYNNIEKFEQHEEDRLIIQNVIDLIESRYINE